MMNGICIFCDSLFAGIVVHGAQILGGEKRHAHKRLLGDGQIHTQPLQCGGVSIRAGSQVKTAIRLQKGYIVIII